MAFDQITTIFLAVLFLTIGTFIIKKVGIFQRFCIPAPVVGGLLSMSETYSTNNLQLVGNHLAVYF
ncbi:sodium/glutamate symporter [Ureibacillus thermosphaericus]|uniref:sodium/glutamate symporter n=1 Tax=Ureibacillus thermosphaericus TaxID=51173 RepID=UPI0030C96E02